MTPLLSTTLLRAQSDERLVQLAGSGNERAFEAIVERYRKPLQRYCERALSGSQAEDVVQQVLTKAWVALERGTEVRHLKPWLYRIAHTTALEAVQAGFDYDQLESSLRPSAGEESEPEQRAVIRKTLTGLAALPEAQREALLRAAVHGQSRAEIAQALGVSEGAVRQLLHRARASLRTVATTVTPLPLLNWLTTIGQSDPAMARTAEAGLAGAAGVTGLAKASAIVASAGMIAAGPAAVHHMNVGGPEKAQAKSTPAPKAARRHKAKRVARGVTPATQPVALVRAAPKRQAGDDERERNDSSGEAKQVEENDRNDGELDNEHKTPVRAASHGDDGAHAESDPHEADTPDESP